MKKTNVIMAMALMSSVTFADVQKTSSTNKLQVDKDVKSLSKTVSNDSTSNRIGKKFNINANLFGLSFSTASVAAEAAYYLNPTTTVGLQFTSLRNTSPEATNSPEEDKIWEKHGVGSAISVNMKKYVANSFYIKPSVYHRSQELVESTTTYGSTLIRAEYGEIEDMGVGFAIGNQWQWENFTLGTDWVGYTKSVSILDQSGTKEFSTGDLDSLSLLNFYVGASF